MNPITFKDLRNIILTNRKKISLFTLGFLIVLVSFFYLSLGRLNQAAAQTFAQEVIAIYQSSTQLVLTNVDSIFLIRDTLAENLVKSLDDLDALRNPLYTNKLPDSKPNNTQDYSSEIENVFVSQNSIAEQLNRFESIQTPPNGNTLQDKTVAYLLLLQSFSSSLDSLAEIKKFLSENLDVRLSNNINTLILKDELDSSDEATIEESISLAKNFYLNLESYKVSNPDLAFFREYYVGSTSLIIQDFTEIESLLRGKELEQANREMDNFHATYFGFNYDFQQGLQHYINATYLESGLIQKLEESENSLLSELSTYIDTYNLNLKLPHSSISQRIQHYAIDAQNDVQPSSSESKLYTKEYYVGKHPQVVNFLLTSTLAASFDFAITDPNGNRYTKDVVEKSGFRFSQSDSYQLYHLEDTNLTSGFWVMEATGPSNIAPTLSVNDRGSSIYVDMQLFKTGDLLRDPIVIAFIITDDGASIDDAVVTVYYTGQVFASEVTDAMPQVNLSKLSDQPELEKYIQTFSDPSTIYVGEFSNTDHFGSYCFRGIAEWPDASGRTITRDISAGCKGLYPNQK